MTSTSRMFLAACLLLLLSSAACGGRTTGDSAAGSQAAAPALSPAHQADNRATDQVEADRNAGHVADDANAPAAYRIETRDRLATIDASLAKLAATSANAPGLRTRRDQLAGKLAAMPATADATWVTYRSDVDALFVGIERDLRAAR